MYDKSIFYQNVFFGSLHTCKYLLKQGCGTYEFGPNQSSKKKSLIFKVLQAAIDFGELGKTTI